MSLKTKINLISFGILTTFFIVGWQFGFSPVKNSIEIATDNVKIVKNKLLGLPDTPFPSNYISRNQHKTDIIHYDLSVDLYPKEKHLKGIAVITGTFTEEGISSLDLNFYDNMKINFLALNGEETSFLHTGTKLSIPLDVGEVDTFRVEVRYEGTPKSIGLSSFVFGEINGRSVVYNLNEPVYASTWFPCNDIPYDKALTDVRITNDSIYTSVSNGILLTESLEKNRKTAHWRTIYPISTYLISIYSSEYVNFTDHYVSEISGDTLPIEYYVFGEHLQNARIDFAEHPRIINFFSDRFGEYPFIMEKYGIAEFLWQLGAMEHQTITGIGSNFVSGRKFFTDIYVHELAHQWWGDAVGPKSWKDIWLNEGFATYCEALYHEYKAGPEALQSFMLSKFNENFSGTLYDPGENIYNLFSSTIYNKGAWVLHMLRSEVGDSIFFKILRRYYNDFKYKSAGTSDFVTVCEAVYGKELDRFFDQWVYTGSEMIKMNINWKIKSVMDDSVIVEIEFRQIQEKYQEFYFPVELMFKDRAGKTENVKFYIDKREKTIEQEITFKPEKIIADPNNKLLADISILGPNDE